MNLVAVLLPPLAVVVAAVLSWNEFVEPVDLVILAVGYGLTCVGITVGFHRLLTHRAFQTYPCVRYTSRCWARSRSRDRRSSG